MTESYQANNRRIAKNTLFLYVRMVFALLVTLYTSRVLLDVLGVEDYGLYNVVGGVVAMLGFFNGAMVSSTQRFFSFAIGRNDTDQLRQNYSAILLIQVGLALLVILLAETVGLWFVRTYLVIPPGRFDAALWVYHLAILSFAVTMLQVPFTALIITHERMDAYALISIADILLKLGVVLVLPHYAGDRLILYPILLFAVTLLILTTYIVACRRWFPHVRYTRIRDRSLYRVLLSYMGWNLWGNSASVVMNQGLNILLNLFFGPAVNAARAVAYQVRAGVAQLSTNFQMAMNPQIVKSYAADHIEQTHKLMFRGAKLSFFLVSILALPVIFNADFVLGIWLKEVPDYAVLFTQLALADVMIETLSGTMMTAIQATGKIARYQSVVGGLLLLNLPVSYVALKLGCPPETVFFVSIAISLASFFARVLIISRRLNVSRRSLIAQLLLRPGLAMALNVMLYFLLLHVSHTILVAIFSNVIELLVFFPLSYFMVAMTQEERNAIVSVLHDKLLRRKQSDYER